MDCFHDDDITQARVVIIMFNRIDDLYNFDVILRHLSGNAVQDVFNRLGVLNCLNPLKPSHDYKFQMKYLDNRIMTHNLLQLSSLENGDQLKQHPKSEIDIISLYAALGRLIQENMNAILQFSYCEIGERQSVPAWNFRKDLLKHFLLGTVPIDNRMFKIISIYKEIEAAGMLLVGPLDLQYREFLKIKSSKKKILKNMTEKDLHGTGSNNNIGNNISNNINGTQTDEESLGSYNTQSNSSYSSLSTVPALPQIGKGGLYQSNLPPVSNESSTRTTPKGSARKLEDVVDINPLLEADYGERRMSRV